MLNNFFIWPENSFLPCMLKYRPNLSVAAIPQFKKTIKLQFGSNHLAAVSKADFSTPILEKRGTLGSEIDTFNSPPVGSYLLLIETYGQAFSVF